MIPAKLPKSIRSEWGRRVLKLNRQLDLRDLRDWLLRRIMANIIVDEVAQTPDRNQETKSGSHSRRKISTVQKVAEDPASNLCERQHFLVACSEFSSLEPVDERFAVVRK